MKKNDLTNTSMWGAILWGLLIAVLFSILGAAIGASIINSGGIPESGTAWITALVWGISVFCGNMVSLRLHKQKMVVLSAITAGIYLVILVALNLLLLEQQLDGLGRALLAVIAGSAAAVLLNSGKRKGKRRKTSYRVR